MVKTHFDEEPEKHLRQGGDEPAENKSETTPNRTDTVRDLTAAWTTRKLETLQLEGTVLLHMWAVLEKAVSQGAEILAGIGRTDGRIANLSQRLDIIERRLESLESGIQRGWQQGAEISRAIAVLEKNLQQARVLVERTADRVDRLSEGFVEREVKEPLLRDIGALYHALQEAMLNESDGIRSIAEYARAILESRGVSLLEPEEGDRFNPGEQPTGREDFHDLQDHGGARRQAVQEGAEVQREGHSASMGCALYNSAERDVTATRKPWTQGQKT